MKRTYEVECKVCHQTKWPSLEARPTPEEGWTCALCEMTGSTAVLARQEAASKAQATRKANKAAGGAR